MSTHLLEIRHLSVSYGKEDILHNITFDIDRGGIVCIAGESGCGKSTLLKAICSYAGTRITDGTISFAPNPETPPPGETPISDNRAYARTKYNTRIGIVPQDPGGSFNPIRTYKKQIREILKDNGMRLSEQEILGTLTDLGLKDADRILNCRPIELSGGMNQRMAIAASMLLHPDLLLCDEITSALDTMTAKLVVDELLLIRRNRGTTILAVLHNLGIAAAMADHLGIMKNGRLIEFGRTHDVLRNPAEDYTRELLRSVPTLPAME